MNNLRYEDVEPQFIGLIHFKVRVLVRKGVGEYADLLQEGRWHAHRAVQTYDPSKGVKLPNYVGYFLDNEYRNIANKAYALMRMPRVWEQDVGTGEWNKVPRRPCSLDRLVSEDGSSRYVDSLPAQGISGLTPEQVADYGEGNTEARTIVILLMARLNKGQRKILKAMVNPDWELHAMVRNLTGNSGVFKVTKRHIAMYLDMTYGQVECEAGRIRRAARALLRERGYEV